MMVKDELAVQLDEFDVLSVEFRSDAGLVVFSDVGELLGDVDFGHGILRGCPAAACLVDGASHSGVAGKFRRLKKLPSFARLGRAKGARPHTNKAKAVSWALTAEC
jgi:hypothetical protein